MNAACPPNFCASAMICSVSVVLPPDSGPYTSITRPRGNPPTPSAASNDKHPDGITFTGTNTSLLPNRMIEPLPWSFSICDIAASSNFVRSSVISHLGRGNRLHLKFSTVAAMLQLVIHQLGQRLTFPPVPLRPFIRAELSQASKVLPARPNLNQLKFKSLMFARA